MEIASYLEELSSKSPAPGGGSAAALSASIAASLNSMVSEITARKNPEFSSFAAKARQFRDALLRLMQEDTYAFLALMQAFRSKDSAQISEKAISASLAPLRTAELSLENMVLAIELLEKGSQSVFTDAAAAVFLSWASVHSALLNVSVNLPSIADEEIRQDLWRKRYFYTQKADQLLESAQDKIQKWQNSKQAERK